ncbi:hypothetical protein [Candidatus Chloroploca sp. Khr17]|uniref:hypothetical protein n=1 Tax=Candidatus Chloroploca sp. Khr17 TaxID=2496869 RepID=UPI00101BE281|nr:hypothetical protein [Candidatus Chloroploca sp. Khr17]
MLEDLSEYSINYFYWFKQKNRNANGTAAVRRPSLDMLKTYATTFADAVSNVLQYQNERLNAVVYQNGTPLSVVGFLLTDQRNAQEVQVVETKQAMKELLRRLDKALLEQKSPSLFSRRHVRIYDGDWLYLVRPSEQRFWTRTLARADADSTIAEMMNRAEKHRD